MTSTDFLDKETKLDIKLKGTKDEQRVVTAEIDAKKLELEDNKKNNKTDKKDIRSQKFERLKQKLYLRAVKRRIIKVNNREDAAILYFVMEDEYITLASLKSLMGNLDFLGIGTDKELKLDQITIERQKYVRVTNELYSRVVESIRNDKARYVLYKNEKIDRIVEISSNISKLKRSVKTRNSKIKDIQSQIKELKNKRAGINKAIHTTIGEITTVSDEFTKEDAPKVAVLQEKR